MEQVEGETLVYDLRSDRAHCLNDTASRVWRRCDGRTSPGAIARDLARETGSSGSLDLVRLALQQLADAGLLEHPERAAPPRVGRREVARKLALVGGLSVVIPAVTSILAPTAAQAASPCVKAANCNGNDGADCSATCNGSCVCVGGTCQQSGGGACLDPG